METRQTEGNHDLSGMDGTIDLEESDGDSPTFTITSQDGSLSYQQGSEAQINQQGINLDIDLVEK